VKSPILLLLTVLAMFFVGCSSTDSPTQQVGVGRLVVNNAASVVGDRVQPVFEPVVLSPVSGKSGGARTLPEPLTLIAQMSPPQNQNGVEVRASFVHVVGDRVYVGYNREGDVFAGAVEIIDISNPSQPTVISQALFEDIDVASLQLIDTGDKLFIGGGKNPDLTGFERSAIVEIMDLSGGLLSTTTSTREINGWVTNGLAWASPDLWCSGGNSASVAEGGGVGSFQWDATHDFTAVVWDTFPRAQYLVGDGTNIVSLQGGSPGVIKVYNSTTGSSSSFNTDNIAELDDRNTILIDNGRAWVALGQNGLKVYDLSAATGTPVYHLPRPLTAEGGVDPEYLTHSVALDDDYVYVANGAGGLYVTNLPDTQGQELSVLGTWDFGSSANYVVAQNDLVFVASGTGGLKILRKNAHGLDGSVILNNGDTHDYLHQAAFNGFPSGTFTIEFWMKDADNMHRATWFSYASTASDDDCVISSDEDSKIEFELAGDEYKTNLHSPTLGLDDRQWHHLALSWDNTAGDVAVYVDGVSVHTATGVYLGDTTTDGGHLIIGQEQDSLGGGLSSSQRFTGSMSDLRIWGTVRTPSQISENYQSRLTGNETGLVSYWPLNEGTGTTCGDLAGSNDLVFEETPEWGPGFDIGN